MPVCRQKYRYKSEMVEKDDLGWDKQWRAEGKKMPVLIRQGTVEPKSEGSVVRGGEQHDVTAILDGTSQATVLKQFHESRTNL